MQAFSDVLAWPESHRPGQAGPSQGKKSRKKPGRDLWPEIAFGPASDSQSPGPGLKPGLLDNRG